MSYAGKSKLAFMESGGKDWVSIEVEEVDVNGNPFQGGGRRLKLLFSPMGLVLLNQSIEGFMRANGSKLYEMEGWLKAKGDKP
jgi:hypothetical protein